MNGPDPAEKHPMDGQSRVGFLKPLVDAPNIEIGDYTYYDDPNGPEGFVERCVLYHYPFIGDKLVIGRFCAIAEGVQFIMNGANHAMAGFSTYPFNIFGNGWEEGFDIETWNDAVRGDTIVGNDVWIGRRATIMPGVNIGDGAVIAAEAVVARDVEPYTIVGGNPAKEIRKRFAPDVIQALLDIRWWDADIHRISANIGAIVSGDIESLRSLRHST